MMDKDRKIAYEVLLEVMRDGMYSNLAMNKASESKDINSLDFVRRLVYGTIEKTIYIDYFLSEYLSKGLSKTDIRILTILRMGAYQIDFMDSVPDYAAIDTSVDLAKNIIPGMDKLVNGVLRNWQRNKDNKSLPSPEDCYRYFSVKYSCNIDVVRLLIDQYGVELAEKILKAEPPDSGMTVRVNLLKTSVAEMKDVFERRGLNAGPSPISDRILSLSGDITGIIDSDEFENGCFSVQSEGSCWIADNAMAKPDMRVLDLCAAPGGKTIAMAEDMKNEGEIIAVDIYPHRLKLIEKNAARHGIDIIKTMEADGTKINEGPLKGELFDLVLIDAPCSGIGVIKKKPEIGLRTPGLKELNDIQKKLIVNGASLLKPGGRLIYSTCSIIDSENNSIVEALIEGGDYSIEMEETLLPHENPRCDGFYLAVIKKGDHPYGCGV